MAETSIEFYTAFFDRVKDIVFADEACASSSSLRGRAGVRGADDGNTEGSVHWIRKAQAVPDSGAILGCAKANAEVVFRGRRRLTDLEGSNVPHGVT